MCIIGPDGSGKTTQARMLVETLLRKGMKSEYRWVRFFHLFSLPLLVTARLAGMSEDRILPSGRRIGYHHFHRSKIISSSYPILMLLDTTVMTVAKVYLPMRLLKKSIVCDRFIFDTIVDIMISIGNHNLHNEPIGGLFLGLVPSNTRSVLLIADEEILRQRRDNVYHDNALDLKIDLYKRLAEDLRIPVVDASLPMSEVQEKIKSAIALPGVAFETA